MGAASAAKSAQSRARRRTVDAAGDGHSANACKGGGQCAHVHAHMDVDVHAHVHVHVVCALVFTYPAPGLPSPQARLITIKLQGG